MKKPCLDCGRPADGARCVRCGGRFEQIRQNQQAARRQAGIGARRPYDGDYRRRAKAVREATVACWICGEGWRPNDPWQADHIRPGDPDSPLAGAHRSCNISRANKARSKG